jgi:hypothetical protein
MISEPQPATSRTDEACFGEIEGLLAIGWRFCGNFFEQDQTYRLVVNKEGEEKIFRTTKPYPKIVDVSGNMMG